MENELIVKTAVDLVLEEDRKLDEAKAIHLDLERLISVSPERKRRWIWELLQNAADFAPKGGVNIQITLQKGKLIYQHDSSPFELKSILALVRRTSSKPYENTSSSTGKFGTGFVTTHVLNRKVTIKGLLKNDLGTRPFQLMLDRTPSTPHGILENMTKMFSVINGIYERPPEDTHQLTVFEFDLDNTAEGIAAESITEFEKNIDFTLLINKDRIRSVVIKNEIHSYQRSYTIAPEREVVKELKFVRIHSGMEEQNLLHTDMEVEEEGLISYSENKVIIALPVTIKGTEIRIKRIDDKARLYKEFPLIGTEQFHIPFFLQSEMFLPSEPRDGIRTFKATEEGEDPTADQNRTALIQYRNAVYNIFNLLSDARAENLYLLAESGLPEEKTLYTAVEWYNREIQTGLRGFFVKQPLVKNTLGEFISLEKARIPEMYPDRFHNKEFYEIASLYYTQVPSRDSFEDWQMIVSQQSERWNCKVSCTIDDLVQEIGKEGSKVEGISLGQGEDPVKWLNRIIGFLHPINRLDIAEAYPIYIDQDHRLRKRKDMQIDPGLNTSIKSIASRLGQPVYNQLLNNDIKNRNGLATFNTKDFYEKLNIYIGKLTPSNSTQKEFEAVFELVCMFSESHAKEREKWFQLVSELYPELAGRKVILDDMADYNWSPAEKSSIKYVCWVIQELKTFKAFAEKHFNNDADAAYNWINRFIEVLFRNQEYEELIRNYAVLPMQDGNFKKLEGYVFCEPEKYPFEPLFKELYKEFTRDGDPKRFIIDRAIRHTKLPIRPVNAITETIDELFKPNDAEHKVGEGQPYKELFHKLNEWVADPNHEKLASDYFPMFQQKRPVLYVKAFGPEVSKMVIAIHKIPNAVETIEAITKLKLSITELQLLKQASLMAGGTDKLLEVAKEIEYQSRQAAWRKKVGDAAENAFKEAISELKPFLIDNPDYGYDFEITIPGREEKYLLEIKSTMQGKENIKMSSKQGQTASANPMNYALCVLPKLEADDEVNKDYFIKHAVFVPGVGSLVSGKVSGIENGLNTIRALKTDDVSAELDNERYSVFVGKKKWNEKGRGIDFDTFIQELKKYFGLFS